MPTVDQPDTEEIVNWPLLALLALAASRAVHLIADDLFPFAWVRDRLDKSRSGTLNYIGHGLSCTFCLSVWAGAAASGLSLWQGWAPEDFWIFVVLWWAFAQAIVLIESVVDWLGSS